MELLLDKRPVDTNALYKVSMAFPKVLSDRRTTINTGVALVNNSCIVIKVKECVPKVVLLDTGA